MSNVKTDLVSPDGAACGSIAEAFAHPAFLILKQQGAPSLIVAAAPFRVVWANGVAHDLFAAKTRRDLGGRLSGSAGGLAQRLTFLLNRLEIGGTPRLERLRFVQSLSSRTITVLCQRVERPAGQDGLAIAVLGFEQDIGADGLSIWQASPTDPEDVVAPAAVPPGPAAVVDQTRLPAVRDTLRAALGGQETGRFVWRTDAGGTLIQADTHAFTVLAAPVVPSAGTVFSDVVQPFDGAGAARLASALAGPTTWSGVEILWPVASGALVLPMVLRASPWFDAARGFAGFKGFGTFDLAGLRAIEPGERTEELVQAPGLPAGRAGEAQRSEGAEASVSPAVPAGEGSSFGDDKPVDDPPGVTGPEAGSFASPANVVRLRPLAPARSAPPMADRPAAEETADLQAHDDVIEAPALQPGPEAFEPLVVNAPGGRLSSSDYEAFEEIGRTLNAQAAGPVSDEAPDAALAGLAAEALDPGPPPPDAYPADDLSRNAAALVETTTTGLLVVRGRMLLFANQAVLDLLLYATHADFEVAVGGALAQQMPLQEGASINLPRHDGETSRFKAQLRPIEWTGGGAQLLTLREIEPAPAAAPATAFAPDARALLDATNDAVALVDGTGGLLLLNQQGERWFGRERCRLAGESFTLLLAPESRAAAAAMLSDIQAAPQGARPDGAAQDGATELRRDVVARSVDGPLLALDMRLARIGPDRFSVVWRDLSALKQSERDFARARSDAERASDRQPELLAKLSHQIRTPLNAIIGFAEIMTDERFGALGNPRYKDYLKDIHTSGTQVMNVVNDLLDLSRIEAGRHELDLGAVDINRIIGECVTQMQPEAHRGRVIVRTSFSPRQPMIMADARAARQIIGNLLSNAVKFNEPGGQVIVSTTTGETGLALVRIRDTGIGMSERDIASALEPFRQLAPSKQADGTGLGLPLTKALVGANGASLSIRSRPGEGTMVEVTFQPAATPARVPA